MIKGISYWSFPGGLEGTAKVSDVFKTAKKAGYESVEVCLSDTGDVSMQTTEKSAKDIVAAAGDAGVKISSVACGLYWGKSLTASDPKIRQEAIDISRQLIDVAKWLDAGAVLIVPGAVDVFFDPGAEVVEYSAAYDRSTEAIGKLAPHAESAKIAIGLENVWNKFLVGPMEMAAFVDQFKSDYVGCYFDVGNCMTVGYPEQWIKVLGKRIKRVHFKDFVRGAGTAFGFTDLLVGDVNWPAVIAALKAIGYDSFVTAEMIPMYQHYPEVRIVNTSAAMDAILGR